MVEESKLGREGEGSGVKVRRSRMIDVGSEFSQPALKSATSINQTT